MEKETIKQKLIAELNEHSILLYAERQKLKQDHLPKDFLRNMLHKNRKAKKISKLSFASLGILLVLLATISRIPEKPNIVLQDALLQLMPILGIIFFSASYQNYNKRIFILELLLNWDE